MESLGGALTARFWDRLKEMFELESAAVQNRGLKAYAIKLMKYQQDLRESPAYKRLEKKRRGKTRPGRDIIKPRQSETIVRPENQPELTELTELIKIPEVVADVQKIISQPTRDLQYYDSEIEKNVKTLVEGIDNIHALIYNKYAEFGIKTTVQLPIKDLIQEGEIQIVEQSTGFTDYVPPKQAKLIDTGI